MQLERKWVEELIFGGEFGRRFTQDSPVLPDVWIAYAAQEEDEAAPLDLLLNPYRDVRPGELARIVQRRLAEERATSEWKAAHPDGPHPALISYNKAAVAVKLTFYELVRVVLPLSRWWAEYVKIKDDPEIIPYLKKRLQHPDLAEAFAGNEAALRELGLSAERLWMIVIVGTLYLAGRLRPPAGVTWDEAKREEEFRQLRRDGARLIQAIIDLLTGLVAVEESGPQVWTVTLNREAHVSVSRSVPAVKADAARLLFNISCRDLTWAVVDSGIDANHPAFRRRDGSDKP
ncbi:MAG TPA: hypothetical protein VFP98_02405, partial [Candidatus Polarisedimenticolia bacterium]|nr:hypothetical protein [Candidatus Polarisedimenticolia bacterium]